MIAYKSEQKDTAWQYGATVGGVVYGSCASLFSNNTTFNQPITIGNKITNCAYMFSGCTNFNQPVTIPSSVTGCDGMFRKCTSFNQPITIPSSVTSCYSMFSECTSFNQPVTLPSGAEGEMFYKCANFNSPVSFDSSFSSRNVFYGCSNMGSNVYFRGTTHADKTMFFAYMQANAKRKNIHFNSALNADFNGTDYDTHAIVEGTVTWTAMTNGFYNATYNIYCYYNYTG